MLNQFSKKKLSKGLFIGISVIVLGNYSDAGWQKPVPLMPARCAEDSLAQWNPGEDIKNTARGRNEWVLKCDPRQYKIVFGKPQSDFSNEFVFITEENRLTRRLYFTFGIDRIESQKTGVIDIVRDSWRAPTENNSSCDTPGNNYPVGLCEAGCVTGDQRLASSGVYAPILQMKANSAKTALQTNGLDPDGVPKYISGNINYYTSDDADAKQEILELTLDNGATLKTSLNHPLVDGNGYMRTAETLKVGATLFGQDGKQKQIVAIARRKIFGRLHNITFETNDATKSIYLLEGVLSGDKKFQIDYVNFVNHKIFRQNFGKKLL